MRRTPDVNVRSGGRTRNRLTKREKRNAVGAQETEQRLSLRAVGMKRHIHRVVMIEAPAIVNRALAKDSDRQRLLKRVKVEALNFPGVRQGPGGAAVVANEGGGLDHAAFRHPGSGQLSFRFRFEQRVGNLRVGARDAPVYFANFVLSLRKRAFAR